MAQRHSVEGRHDAFDRRSLIQAGLIGAFCAGSGTLWAGDLAKAASVSDDSLRLRSCLRAVWAVHEPQASSLSVMVIKTPFLLADGSTPRQVRLSSGFIAACGGPIRTGAWFSYVLASLRPNISGPEADRLALTVFAHAGYDPRLFRDLWQDWSVSNQLSNHGPKGDWPISVARLTALAADLAAMGYLL